MRWAQTLFLGIDVSSCFTLEFSDGAKETVQHRPRRDNLVFEVGEGGRGGTPHDGNIYTGDMLKCFLDADSALRLLM